MPLLNLGRYSLVLNFFLMILLNIKCNGTQAAAGETVLKSLICRIPYGVGLFGKKIRETILPSS